MKQSLNCNGKLLEIQEPKIMGIINITPDSFYDGGKFTSEKNIMEHIEQMLLSGADIIDIGACSSRPNSVQITEQEEFSRLETILYSIRKTFPDAILSVDTYRSAIASYAVNNCGVNIVNDISAGAFDSQMYETIAQLQVPYIIMHIQGTPQTMQKSPYYSNLIQEIIQYFTIRIKKLHQMGIHDIIIDPGFGFGKTLEHNYQLLQQLQAFCIFDAPVLIGISRKSMIYKYLHCTPNDALNGTTVLHTIALQKGANILRVHDVKEAKETIKLLNMLEKVS